MVLGSNPPYLFVRCHSFYSFFLLKASLTHNDCWMLSITWIWTLFWILEQTWSLTIKLHTYTFSLTQATLELLMSCIDAVILKKIWLCLSEIKNLNVWIIPISLCCAGTTFLHVQSNTRPKASGSSSRIQEERGNRLRTRQGQGKDKTGTWQGQDRDKIGTKQGQDKTKVKTETTRKTVYG